MLTPFGFWTLGLDLAQLASEAQAVVALRLARFASGDERSGAEVVRMVSEKMMALGEAHMHVASAAASGQLGDVGPKVVSLYRKKVRANQRRLSR